MPDLGNLRVGVQVDLSGLTRGLAQASAQMQAAARTMSGLAGQAAADVEAGAGRAAAGVQRLSAGTTVAANTISANLGRMGLGFRQLGQIAGQSLATVARSIPGLSAAAGAVQAGIDRARAGVAAGLDAIGGRILAFGRLVGSVGETVVGTVVGWGAAVERLAARVVSPFTTMIGWFGRLGSGVAAVGGRLAPVAEAFGNVFGGLGGIVSIASSRVLSLVGGMVSGVVGAFQGLASGVGRAMGAVVSTVTSGFAQMAQSAPLLGIGLLGAGAGLAYLGVKAVQASSQMEQARIAFGTMLGSAQQADQFISQLQAFAAKTPFNYADVQKFAQQFLAFGFRAQDILPTLTAVGDATAALGGGADVLGRITMALGQMQAKGKVQSDEMLQLTEAGIPAWQMLARVLGTDVAHAQEQVTKGTVDSQKVIPGLVAQMEKSYGGLMQQQSQTTSGLISNLQDTVGQTLVAIGQQLSTTFDLKGKLSGLTDFIGQLKDLASGKISFAQFFSGLTGGAASVRDVSSALDRLHTFVDQVKGAFDAFGKSTEGARNSFLRAVGGFVGAHLDVVLIAITGAVIGLIGFLAVLAIEWIIGFWPVFLVMAIVAGLAVAVYEVITHWSQIVGFFQGLWSTVVGAFWAGVGAVGNALGWVRDTAANVWSTIWGTITGWAGQIRDTVSGIFWGLVNGICQAFSTIGSKVHDGLHGALEVVGSFADMLRGLPFFGGLFQAAGVPSKSTILRWAGFAKGGVVPGPLGAGDIVPALLSPGEVVLSRAAVAGLGGPAAANRLNGLGAGVSLRPGDWGGQCLQFVSRVLGGMFAGIPMAAGLRPYVNSKVAAPGEVFVSTIPPYGHTGFVISGGNVLDSNWGLDERIRIHPLSDIPDVVGYIGGLHPRGLPGGVFDVNEQLRGLVDRVLSGVSGLGGAFARGLLNAVVGRVGSAVSFDHGGILPPGLTLAWNGTGAGEVVLGPGESSRRDRQVVINVTVHGNVNPRKLARELAYELR